MAAKPVQHAPQGRGRPRCGVYRLETMLPKAALDELKRREEKTGVYRTRIAANLLCRELLGGETHSFTRPSV